MVGADGHPARVGVQVVDPVRDGLAQLLVGEVVGVDRFGSPGRLPSASAFLNRPTSSFFLVSTLITGCPAA